MTTEDIAKRLLSIVSLPSVYQDRQPNKLEGDLYQLSQDYLDLLAKSKAMMPVPLQSCPGCLRGPVVIRSECKDCGGTFVDSNQSNFNKVAISKYKD